MYIIDEDKKEYFYFGKSVGISQEVFDLVSESKRIGDDFNTFLSLFPSEKDGWGVDVIGAKRLFDWLNPETAKLYCDSGDFPWHTSDSNQWWSCKGSIFSDKEEDIFGGIGYLQLEKRHKYFRGSGELNTKDVENIQAICKRYQIKFVAKDFPLAI
jgi:hypothetical protein